MVAVAPPAVYAQAVDPNAVQSTEAPVVVEEKTAEAIAQDLLQAQQDRAALEVAKTEVETMRQAIADLRAQVVAVQAERDNLLGQVDEYKRLDSIRQQIDELQAKAMEAALLKYDNLIKGYEVELATKAHTLKVLEAANAELDKREKRGIWQNLKELFIGLAAFAAGKFF